MRTATASMTIAIQMRSKFRCQPILGSILIIPVRLFTETSLTR